MTKLTTNQVAEKYGVSTRTLGRLKDDGKLTPVDELLGRNDKVLAYLYDAEEVAKFFETYQDGRGKWPRKKAGEAA